MRYRRHLLQLVALAGSFVFLTGFGHVSRYADAIKEFPPILPGSARIYFFRGNEAAGVGSKDSIKIDGSEVSVLVAGTFSYVDRPAGDYTINCNHDLMKYTEDKEALKLSLSPGDTKYIRISHHPFSLIGSVLMSSCATPVVENANIVDSVMPKKVYKPYKICKNSIFVCN